MENSMSILCIFVAVFTLQAAKCLCFIPETEEVSVSAAQRASDALASEGSSTLWSAHKEPGSAGYRLQKFPFALKTEGGAVIGVGGSEEKRGFWDKRSSANRRVLVQLQELPQGVLYYPH